MENACRTSAGFSATARVSGGVYIEERSFVAKGAPLDDGQKRLGGWTGRLGEADRLVKGAGGWRAEGPGEADRLVKGAGWVGAEGLGEADRLVGGARIEDLRQRAQRKAGGKRIVCE